MLDYQVIEELLNKVDILRKNKEKILKYFSELKEKRPPDGSITYEEKELFIKLTYFIKEEAKKAKGLDENGCFITNDDDKNNENQDYDVLEKIKNMQLSYADKGVILSKKQKKERDEKYYKFILDTGGIEIFIDKIYILRKGKKKIMDLIAELRKKRGPDGLVTEEEKILEKKIMFLYLLQMHETKKEKKDKKNDLLSNNKDKNLDNINKDDDEEIDVIKLLKNIKLPDHDTSNKKNEDNYQI